MNLFNKGDVVVWWDCYYWVFGDIQNSQVDKYGVKGCYCFFVQ